jgi:hypothetical protein
MDRPLLRWSLLILVYLALALVITWPLALHMHDGLLGTPTMDQVDTAWLRLASARWLTGQDPGIFAPLGYPLPAVVPNWMDHLLGAPLALLLPWPLADNLFWLGLIAANGLAGHALGRAVGGSDGAGLLCGLGFALCEPVLREINASHAPQALVLWSPLFLLFLLRTLGAEGRARDGVMAGLFLGLSAATYWYQGLFLAVLAAPVTVHGLLQARREGALAGCGRRLGLGASLALLLCGPLLAASLVAAPELAGVQGDALRGVPDGHGSSVPAVHAWAFLHGSGLDWIWRSEPIAMASRSSPVLLLAAAAGSLSGARPRWPWWLAAGLGAALLMGPFLQWAGEPVQLGEWLVPLPGYLLAQSSELLARLHWPQRWALLVPLALLPLAARAPWPRLLAGLLLLETIALSGNAPLQVSPVGAFAGWSALAGSEGPVLVLPQEPQGDGASSMGLIYRASHASLANELGIPPRAAQPLGFRQWNEGLALRRWWRELLSTGVVSSRPPGALAQLEASGVVAVALDVTPGCTLSPQKAEHLAAQASRVLGEPTDLGSAMVWWLAPPPQPPPPMPEASTWRRRRHAEAQAAGCLRRRVEP